jgi:site-specific recombinase XerD
LERSLAGAEKGLSRWLGDVSWHTFRHTFASRLTRKGVDLVTVKELLGHSSVTVTMRYAHTNRETRRWAVGMIEGNGAKMVTVPFSG